MNLTQLDGVGAKVLVDAEGITIRKLVGGERRIPWNNVGGATITPATLLKRSMFLVLTSVEVALVSSDTKWLSSAAARQANDWAVPLPMGANPTAEAMKTAINKMVAHRIVQEEWRARRAVLCTATDGMRYAGTLAAVEPEQCLVVFPDGRQHWIARGNVALA